MRCATAELLLLLLLFFLTFVRQCLCVAEKPECNATETSNGAFYSVPAPKCSGHESSWSNSSGYVLANSDRKAEELVNFSNDTFLHTYGCHEEIRHDSYCDDKWEKVTTICEIKCSHSTGVPDSNRRGLGNGAGTSRHNIPIPLALLSVLLAHI